MTIGFVVGLAPVSSGRVLEQCAKTAVVVVALFIGFRLAGKRELTQLNVYDLAMLMALSNAVQNAMTAGLGNLPVGLATSATIVVAAWAIIRLIVRRQGLERPIMGTPTLLVFDGKVLMNRLRREEITVDQVAQACRERGVADPAEARMVVLEVDGSLSVVPAAKPGQPPAP